MRCVIVIPARFASTRLPGKPLLRATGKYLIEHVYDQAQKARCAQRVIIATDDSRIEAAVKSFGGEVAMTSSDHCSGTDRIAEVMRSIEADVVINVQGDEPMVEPEAIDLLPELMARDPQSHMATLAVPFRDREAYRNPACVKVVCDRNGRAMYFSRSPIPMVRDGEPDFTQEPPLFLHHLGLYAYRRDALLALSSLPAHPLEEAEKLEQLRALAQGWIIQVGVVAHAGRGVDTPEDYERFLGIYRAQQQRIAA